MPGQEPATIDRTAILARYRGRIARRERTKLTQIEQDQLVSMFLDDLQLLNSPSAIEQRCAQEIALLEEGYPIQTIASRLLAPYRRAIREAIDAGTLALSRNTSHVVRYTKYATGQTEETQEHWALTHLKYDQATYQQLRGQTIEHNNARQDELQPVRVDPYLATVTELLTEDDPHTLTAAIAAATGRRHTEVVARGRFEPTDHPYVLRFTGQQKKRDGQSNETAPFDIVTIVPARTILDALVRLRKQPSVQTLQQIPSVHVAALRAFNTQVNREVKRRFEDSGIVPRIAGARSVSIHRLRGVYAAIAVYLWCPPDQHEHRFIQHYLGHVLKDTNMPNSNATTHYFHYRLLDGNGKPMHAKGILRDTLGAPPDTTEPPPRQTPVSTRRRPALAAADLDRLQNVTDQLGISGSLGERLHALLDWVTQQQSAPTASATTQEQREATIEPTPSAMTSKQPGQPPESQDVPISAPATPTPGILPIVSDQAKTLAWLTDEITMLRQQLATIQQADAELRTQRAERAILQAKIDSLMGENKTLQRRLERFESLGRALWGNGDPAATSPQIPSAIPATAERAYTADTSMKTTARPQAAPPPTALPSSRGQERAARIWQTIQTWNDTPNRSHHEKVALSASVLEKRFGLFRPTAKAFLEAHQHEIDAHSQAHGITAPTHNRGVPDAVWETLKQQAR